MQTREALRESIMRYANECGLQFDRTLDGAYALGIVQVSSMMGESETYGPINWLLGQFMLREVVAHELRVLK